MQAIALRDHRNIKSGDHTQLILPGTEYDKKPIRLATWNNRKAARRFDLDTFVGHLCPGALPGEHALYIEDARRTFTVAGEPGRTFLIK